jgi:hypothetical protein
MIEHNGNSRNISDSVVGAQTGGVHSSTRIDMNSDSQAAAMLRAAHAAQGGTGALQSGATGGGAGGGGGNMSTMLQQQQQLQMQQQSSQVDPQGSGFSSCTRLALAIPPMRF